MTQATDTDIRDIKTAIEANTKSIADLTTSFTGLREEMRAGFSKTEIQITEIRGDIKELRAELKGLDTKFDERTKLSFWGFILRGLVLTALIGVGTYLLPVVAEYVHKLPPL
jgi:hypothetical protein